MNSFKINAKSRVLLFHLVAIIILSSCNNYKTEELVLAEKSIPDEIDYNFHVRPILSDKCFACHGPDKAKQEAGLRLDTWEGATTELQQTAGKYAIVPGKPGKSIAFERIMTSDPETVMPPYESHLKLTSEEKAIIARWIEQGAKYKDHWAFQLPEKTNNSKKLSETVNAIDNYVQRKLAENELDLNDQAEKEILLRRVSFDLTGLPPTLEELDSYTSGKKSYGEMVDYYLASEAYGEKMASEWLDLARYADTHGYQSDGRRRMWPWRDWVIKAFNENMPYDKFVKWQLAGDKYPDPTLEQMIATGFNRNHLINVEGGIIAEEYRVEYVLDRTNTLGKAFLGLSLECARCHDHKYDPISQKEYFETSYFFNNVDEMGQGQRDFGEAQPPSVMLTSEEEDNLLLFLEQQTQKAEKNFKNAVVASENDYEQWVRKINLKSVLKSHTINPIDSYSFENPKEFKSVKGVKGKAVEFDGGSGLYFPGKLNFERYDSFSYSFYIKAPEPNGTLNFFTHSTGEFGGFRGIEMQMVDNQLEFRMSHIYPNNAIRVRTKETVRENQWIHVGITYDGSSKAKGLRIFFDGKLQEMSVLRDNLYKSIIPYHHEYSDNTFGIVFGFQGNAQGFAGGALDEFKIYDKELSEVEINILALNTEFTNKLFSSSKNELIENADVKEFYLLRKSNLVNEQKLKLTMARKIQNDTLSNIPEVMVMTDIQDSIRKTYVLDRGNYDAHGEEVGPGLPKALIPKSENQPKTRMELAEWLVSKENPLTARVTVNRFWQSLFGRGLVETSNDFGSQGSLPTHPELLDWLAIEFVESGWDVKQLMKLIVMSKTYQQSSQADPKLIEKDPNNELLARGPRFRLSAEMIRDNILAASGLLVKKVGGPSVKPYQPEAFGKRRPHLLGKIGTNKDQEMIFIAGASILIGEEPSHHLQ